MSANFENKKVVVSEIENLAKDAKSIVLVDYRGLTVAQATALRNEVRAAGGTYKVYKNRLMKIAFEKNGIEFPAWKDTEKSNLCILYATNSNGETALYQFDSAEGTYQRFEAPQAISYTFLNVLLVLSP